MVPGPVTGPAESGLGSSALRFHLVGPIGDLAADSAFAVALAGLWCRVAETDAAAVGCTTPPVRRDVSLRVAGLVEGIRRGRVIGTAATADRALVGCALLEAGTGARAHTGTLAVVLTEPARQHRGIGTRLLDDLLVAAPGTGIRRISAAIEENSALETFFARFGFAPTGRRPGWISTSSDQLADEIILTASVGPNGSGRTHRAGTPS